MPEELKLVQGKMDIYISASSLASSTIPLQPSRIEAISKTEATLAALTQASPSVAQQRTPQRTPPPHHGMSRFCNDVLVGGFPEWVKSGGFMGNKHTFVWWMG